MISLLSIHRSVSAVEITQDMTVVGVSLVTMDPIALSHKLFPDVKEACYKSMVRPVVEYSSVVRSPFTNTNINLVESFSAA